MTRNIHSVGHAGGTRAPSTWARRCDPNRIGVRLTPNAVPHRAPRCERKGSTSAECCGNRVSSKIEAKTPLDDCWNSG